MVALGGVEKDPIVLSRRKTELDLKVSLGLLFAGIIIYAGYLVIVVLGWFYPNSPAPFLTIALAEVIPGMAGLLILIGAIFATINWSLLRRGRAGTRPIAARSP